MHFRKADRKVEAYDGRETAPATIRPDVFLTDGKRRSFRDVSTGGAAVGVPGVIRMLAMAHRDHGRLPWNRLFEPAIAYAENGFSVSPRLNKMISRAKDMKNFPAARAYFYTAQATRSRSDTGCAIRASQLRCAGSPERGRLPSTAAKSRQTSQRPFRMPYATRPK